MIAAIYARKSTAQDGVADDAKSVMQQVEGARAYIASKGWTVADEHVYTDDGISGAEFKKRPGLTRLRSVLGRRAPFRVLVVRDPSRLGREMNETGMVIKELDEAGCEVWSYTEDRCLTPRSSVDKIVSNVQSFADENHREKARQQVTEAHTRLAHAGHVCGGRVFGYRNVDIFNGTDPHGRPLRSHVERVIDETEAAVVRRMFALYDSGLGLKRIAKLLTSEGAPAPRHFHGNDGLAPVVGWSPSTVRSVLTRETYHGVVVWNKTRKRNNWGKWAPTDRPESEWVRTRVPALRIIDETLWRRVESRRQEVEGTAVRFESGRLSGRPRKDAEQNLLAGLATCGVCGGGLVVEQSNNRKGRYAYYICHRHRHNGTCANALRIPVAEMNEAILSAIEEHALTPEAVEQVVRLTEREDIADQHAALERERKEVERRIGRLVAAVETGGDVPSLVAKIRELEMRRTAIDGEQAALRPVPRLAPRVVEERLAEWRRLLRQSTIQGRTVLQRVLRGRVRFTPRPDGSGYDFEAATRFDKLFTGIAVERPAWIPEGGPIFPAEDTLDADYGRILERAFTEKGWRARQDLNLRPSA